ncbi:MAG: PP0621 family protein [Usitatibacter sp.]
MPRILFLLFIAFLVYLLFRGFFRARVKDDKPADALPKAEDMVQCSRCAVNMPRSEAREEGGKLVCLNNPQCKP